MSLTSLSRTEMRENIPCKHFQCCVNADRSPNHSHLHGHKFQIVGRSQDYTSSDPTLNPPIVEGQGNPMRRDTVMIPSKSSATLRVVANNPGAWFMHCKWSSSLLWSYLTSFDRPYRMASGIRVSYPANRGASSRSTTEQCSPSHVRQLQSSREAFLWQRGWLRIDYRFDGPPRGSLSPTSGMASQGYWGHVRVNVTSVFDVHLR
jgi:Multicopper oxidase